MAPAQREPKVVVLGGGSWGTTVASICARRGPTLQWVRFAGDRRRHQRRTTATAKYLGDEVELAPTLQATTDFSEAADCADVIVMGVPSHGFRGVLTELAKELRPWVPVVSLVKGLEQGTNYADERRSSTRCCPAIRRASWPARTSPARSPRATPPRRCWRCPTSTWRPIWENCSAPGDFATYTTDDVVGVEMAGALKNVYAIAVGMGYSLGIGENTRALVIARAVREMSKLGEAMGGHRETFAGLAGMGDLIVTCTSQRSRNRHVGEQLGAGKPIDEIIASMNQVAEGVKAASVIMEFAKKYGLTMPIAREVDGVVNHGSTVEEAYRGLAAEKPGHEVHGSGF